MTRLLPSASRAASLYQVDGDLGVAPLLARRLPLEGALRPLCGPPGGQEEKVPATPFVLVRGLVVGVTGIEPVTSSVSVDSGRALRDPGISQVVADRKGWSKAFTLADPPRGREGRYLNRPSDVSAAGTIHPQCDISKTTGLIAYTVG